MAETQERMAFPLTFLLKKEGEHWASLACELDVASCGDTAEEACEYLKEAVELYVSSLLEDGRASDIPRPVPQDALVEFATDPPGEMRVEYHTLLVFPGTMPPTMEFVRSMVAPTSCDAVALVR